METIPLVPVDSLTITTLVDNTTDLLLLDEGPAKRHPSALIPKVPARFLEGGRTADLLRAEHGFSCLVTIEKAGRTTRILFDAGVTPDGLVENMRRLEISARDIDIIVLSHGHWDHTTGMDGLVAELRSPNLPVLIHPDFWSRRRIAIPAAIRSSCRRRAEAALEGAGFEVIEQQQPSFLLDGSLLVTGEVDRTTDFEQGFPVHEAYRDARWHPDPLILDDQALIASVRGHGLVVLTGCGHSGIVNILRYARKLTGEDSLHAVVGGFHLSGPLVREDHRAHLRMRSRSSLPTTSCPRTARGGAPSTRSPRRFPDAFIQNSVGTRLEFSA